MVVSHNRDFCTPGAGKHVGITIELNPEARKTISSSTLFIK